MDTNIKLVNHLIKSKALKTPTIIKAFKKIDRKDFVLIDYLFDAYKDNPLPIGYGQTISQPTTVAFMLELLQPRLGDKVLDIGSGSGWTTALLSCIVGEKGIVDGYEIVPELVEFGNKNLEKYHLKNTKIYQSQENFSFIKGKYDKILVSAGANSIPKELIEKLKVGGSIVIPVNDYIYKATKLNDKHELELQGYYGFIFVPLIVD